MPRPLQNKDLEETLRSRLQARADLLKDPLPTLVILPDATRPLPFREILVPLLPFLQAASKETEILIGLGLHRKMTPLEIAPILEVAASHDIAVHQQDPADVIPIGRAGPIPVHLNRRVLQARRIIAVGTVEPHQYAGYSGGIKAISIGAAGRETISAMHGLSFLRDPRTTLGSLEGNPFQKALQAIGAHLDAEILGLQCVPAPGRSGALLDLFFDPLPEAFHRAVELAAARFFKEEPALLNWIHLPVPALKATNFYQASRAATYAALVDRPALKEGAPIFLEAPCPEGIGAGSGEKACASAMTRGVAALLGELQDDSASIETRGGEQRAYVLARAQNRNPIALIGAPMIPELKTFGIPQFDSLQEAREAFGITDDLLGKTIADIFHRIPRRK